MPTAIITGASRGFGFAVADALADRGYRLVVDGRDARALERAARVLGATTVVVALAGDVTDGWHRAALVDAAGEIDLLVNNAGVLGPSPQPSLADYPISELERVYDVNVMAPLALIQVAIDRFVAGATVVNVTSDAAGEPYEGWGGYGSAKAALEQIGAVLAVEHPELTVWSIDPGDMRTRMHQDAFPGEDITDRPVPADSVPGLLALLDDDAVESGRYRIAAEVAA